MTAQTDIQAAIVELIAAKAPLPQTDDISALNYVDTGLVDSLGVMSLVVALEDQFDVELSDDAIMSDEFRTIGGLADIIAAALGVRGALAG